MSSLPKFARKPSESKITNNKGRHSSSFETYKKIRRKFTNIKVGIREWLFLKYESVFKF